MKKTHPHSPYRIFAFSAVSTVAILAAVTVGLGFSALVTTLILLVIEITFSFENAIINAKVLTKMSKFWQTMFLTLGIVIAIFGMRIIFPIAIVAISTHTPWREILDLALNNPDQYAAMLESAHPSIAAFGGAFLLMLATSFFFDKNRKVHWLQTPERIMQRYSSRWTPAVLTAIVIWIVAILSDHYSTIVTSAAVGIVAYIAIHGLAEFFGSLQTKKPTHSKHAQVGMAAFLSFLYLEVLDASFSLDGVIGAFAITDKVILIAAGLGAGALWVRSLTVYMVRKGTLESYKYIEHGAHYTVLILAFVMLLSLLYELPTALAGIAGIVIIALSLLASNKDDPHERILWEKLKKIMKR